MRLGSYQTAICVSFALIVSRSSWWASSLINFLSQTSQTLVPFQITNNIPRIFGIPSTIFQSKNCALKQWKSTLLLQLQHRVWVLPPKKKRPRQFTGIDTHYQFSIKPLLSTGKSLNSTVFLCPCGLSLHISLYLSLSLCLFPFYNSFYCWGHSRSRSFKCHNPSPTLRAVGNWDPKNFELCAVLATFHVCVYLCTRACACLQGGEDS